MYRIIVFLSLLTASLTQSANVAGAPLSEASVIEAMKAIETAWQKAIQNQYPLVHNCGASNFSVRLIRRGANLRVDVKKTGTLMHPYVGVVRLRGTIAENFASPKANGGKNASGNGMACFQSMKQALSATGESDLTDRATVDYEFFYEITEDEIKLDSTNAGDNFPRILSENLGLNPQLWAPIVSQRIK